MLASLAISYLLGSVPFGLLLTKAAGLGDIRNVGSGNIGATNVMRTGRKGLGIATLLLDAGKGFAAVWLAREIGGEEAAALAGFAAVLGHVFPLWLKFKGGKGVATAIGALAALSLLIAAAAGAVWLAAFLACRISSLASLTSIAAAAATAYALGDGRTATFCLGLAALLAFTHRANIRRLISGQEHRFTKGGA